MLNIQLEGLEPLRRQLEGFSDRRFRAAVATALTRTARQVQAEWGRELQQQVDRPTPLTSKAAIVIQATAASMVATVSMREQIANGQPPSEYLVPLEKGGTRAHKKFEKALIAQGSMPSGAYAVPTDYAKRDSYGNVTRGQLVQILVQLAGGSVREGYRRVISASATRRAAAAVRSGKQYVAIQQQEGKLAPGIYARVGRQLRMVFAYVSHVRYRRQLSLVDRGRRKVQSVFQQEMSRAIAEHLARLGARKGGA